MNLSLWTEELLNLTLKVFAVSQIDSTVYSELSRIDFLFISSFIFVVQDLELTIVLILSLFAFLLLTRKIDNIHQKVLSRFMPT